MIPFVVVVVMFLRILQNALKDAAFRGLAGSVVIVLAIGTSFYALVEDWKVLDSLYFSVVTLTTVGFGDLTPETALGKVFTIVYIFVGLGFLMAFVTTIVQRSHLWARFDQTRGDEGNGSGSSARAGDLDPRRASSSRSFPRGLGRFWNELGGPALASVLRQYFSDRCPPHPNRQRLAQ